MGINFETGQFPCFSRLKCLLFVNGLSYRDRTLVVDSGREVALKQFFYQKYVTSQERVIVSNWGLVVNTGRRVAFKFLWDRQLSSKISFPKSSKLTSHAQRFMYPISKAMYNNKISGIPYSLQKNPVQLEYYDNRALIAEVPLVTSDSSKT